MPSASAKLEKQSSTDAFDPAKQLSTLLDNKIRNLEKRKGKLDGYRDDFNSGKELNKDQLTAVQKYDQVLEVLDFSRELQKNLKTIIADCQKQQKKASKREVADRQAEQLRRLKEVLLFQDLLSNMGTEQARQDFLDQTNGAVKLTEDELSKLDDLYKLVCPERSPDSGTDSLPFQEQLAASAEHLLHLLDARPKEILGTTYKVLKELLLRIHTCGYFDGGSESQASQEDAGAKEEAVQAEEVVEAHPSTSPLPPTGEEVLQPTVDKMEQPQLPTDDLIGTAQQPIQVENVYFDNNNTTNYIASGVQMQQQAPLTDVLHEQAPINFLQDSQVDLESAPLMDPAVVVAHPMAPPPNIAYHSVPFMGGAPVPQVGPVSGQGPLYEPIPTQTFTNQSFANVVVPAQSSQYIPVNPGDSINQMAMVGSAPIITQPDQKNPQQQEQQQPQKIMRTSPDICLQNQEAFMNVSSSEFQPSLSSSELIQNASLYQSLDDNEENSDGFQSQVSNSNGRQGGYVRGGNRGRPRGPPRSGPNNGYSGGRPRGQYNNDNDHLGTRGGYQGNYNNNNGSSRDYNSSRRGSQNQRGGRGGPRGGPHQQGVGRGGNSYRTQPQMQQQ